MIYIGHLKRLADLDQILWKFFLVTDLFPKNGRVRTSETEVIRVQRLSVAMMTCVCLLTHSSQICISSS